MPSLTFNAETVEPNGYGPIPAGEYVVEIVSSEMRDTRAGDGEYLELEMKILEGEHEGRVLWDRLNLKNRNQQAVGIAEQTLSQICRAVAVLSVSNSEQLHHKPMIAKVRVRPAGPDKNGIERDAANEIRGYRPLPERSATNSAPRPGTPTAAPWSTRA